MKKVTIMIRLNMNLTKMLKKSPYWFKVSETRDNPKGLNVMLQEITKGWRLYYYDPTGLRVGYQDFDNLKDALKLYHQYRQVKDVDKWIATLFPNINL